MKRYKEVILELSKNCNLNCIMCGYGARYNKPHHFMRFELFDAILRELKGDYEVLRLNGRGESTIHPEFVRFLRHARETYPEGRIRLFTNMNYVGDEITKALAECRSETMISLDSTHKDKLESIRKGSKYERVMHNVEELCALTDLTAVVFTLQPNNFFEIAEVAKFAADHHSHFFCNAVRNAEMDAPFSSLVNANVPYLQEAYSEIREIYKGSGLSVHLPAQIAGAVMESEASRSTCADFARCPNAGRDVCVYYDGTVTPCGMFNPFVLGNLAEKSLEEILCGEALARFIGQQATDPYCKNCQYICG